MKNIRHKAKIIPLNKNFSSPETGEGFLQLARSKEATGDKMEAVAAYKKMIKKGFQKELGYQRIMILFRNMKEYGKELEVINHAVEEFKKLYYNRKLRPIDKKVIATSQKLIKLLGISKNNEDHFPDPIRRWVKRKNNLIKKKDFPAK